MSTFAERVERALREGTKLTSAGLARACGIKPPSVSNWLSGKSASPRGQNLMRAAAYLGVNPEWLSSGRGPMRPEYPTKGDNAAPNRIAELSTAYPTSQPVGLNVPMLASAIETVESALPNFDTNVRARIAALVYQDWTDRNLDSSARVASAVAIISSVVREKP